MILKHVLIILFALPLYVFGQNSGFRFPRDTSFSVWSAGQNIQHDFPDDCRKEIIVTVEKRIVGLS